jgi:hypothetical protein
MWDKLFKRDIFWLGIAIGIIFPAFFYVVLYVLDLLVLKLANTHMLAEQKYLYLVSIAINLFAIKYYFVNLKFDKTGRGVLFVTFIFALIYFILK